MKDDVRNYIDEALKTAKTEADVKALADYIIENTGEAEGEFWIETEKVLLTSLIWYQVQIMDDDLKGIDAMIWMLQYALAHDEEYKLLDVFFCEPYAKIVKHEDDFAVAEVTEPDMLKKFAILEYDNFTKKVPGITAKNIIVDIVARLS